ncbi:hypothetical protein P7K49_022748 [Saguinus oedipus]|uniref:Uncharacterized protein n=1 Tax=Saguinus oedipus TaxID=9490 RepID=A0ABQ9ULZ7_SAGOE|nr:hypothetical protein P7K49_022748 [Saguinus oedipus]
MEGVGMLLAGRTPRPPREGNSTRLNLHGLGLDDVHLVLVPTPHTVIHNRHAADRVVRVAQVHQVIVAQVPLAICREPRYLRPGQAPPLLMASGVETPSARLRRGLEPREPPNHWQGRRLPPTSPMPPGPTFTTVEDGQGSVCQSHQHAAFDMPETGMW